MITWIQLWPMLMLPTLFIGLACTLPTTQWQGRIIGGGPVREWLLNHWLLPFLSDSGAASLVAWFNIARPLQEWLLSLLIGINANALLLPALYFAGEGYIQLVAWFAKKDLELKRKGARS